MILFKYKSVFDLDIIKEIFEALDNKIMKQ